MEEEEEDVDFLSFVMEEEEEDEGALLEVDNGSFWFLVWLLRLPSKTF